MFDAPTVRVSTDAYVAPLREGAVGFGIFFPEDEDSEGWSKREDPAGYEVVPGDLFSVIVVAARTGESDGTASNIRVSYEVGGRSYGGFTSSEIRITESCL
jgi:hypothetical protein